MAVTNKVDNIVKSSTSSFNMIEAKINQSNFIYIALFKTIQCHSMCVILKNTYKNCNNKKDFGTNAHCIIKKY